MPELDLNIQTVEVELNIESDDPVSFNVLEQGPPGPKGDTGSVENFIRGGNMGNPQGLAFAETRTVWECTVASTLNSATFKRTNGTGATVNARRVRAGTPANHLASNLSLTTEDFTDGVVQNTDYEVGDILQIMAVSVTGLPTELVFQLDFTVN